MHNANDLFMIRKQYDIKQALRENLNYLSDSDDLRELLFKYHASILGVQWNLEMFNKQLLDETRDEDEALQQLISTSKMIEL